MTQTRWSIRLGAEAERDFARILKYTKDNFGLRQAEIYKATLLEAFAAFKSGPNVPGSAARDEIGPSLRSLHVARGGRRGRHFVIYRVAQTQEIEIVRLLHDAMDFASHIPPDGK